MPIEHEQAIKDYWGHFLYQHGKAPGLPYFFCGYLGGDEDTANQLLSLILTGSKTATTSCALSYRAGNEPLPQAGDLSIITDWAGNPGCVIETTRVTILPFEKVTRAMIRKEGGEGSLAAWQAAHFDLFSQEGMQLGYVFARETPVVIEDFRVVCRGKTRMP